jgi:Gpi18-like mannosyltransferase
LLAPYTESLFLASSVAAFWFARQGRPWLGGLAGAGAVLARTFGIILVLPLAFEYLRQRDQKGKHPGFGLLAATLPAMALIVQSVYDRLIVGERQSVFQLAAAWGDRIVPPWRALPDSVSHIARAGDGVELLNLLCLVGFALLAIACVRRLPLLYGLFVVPYLGLMFSRESMVSPLESVCRYVLVLFPCFIILAMWLAKRPRLAVSALVVGGMLQAMLFQYWVHWGFVA